MTPPEGAPTRMTDEREWCLELCDCCGSEGRIYQAAGRWQDGSPREEDLGECPVCKGTGEAYVECEPVTIEDLDYERL